MAEEWIIKVLDKEYGPVDLETLREWREEGRLLPENEVRRSDREEWTRASEIGELFAPEHGPPSVAGVPLRRLSFGQILLETVKVYRKGFLCFFSLSLLVAIPAFAMQLASPSLNLLGGAKAPSNGGLLDNIFGLSMFLLWLAAWPLFVAGLQLATADLAAGRPVSLPDVLRRAAGLWVRFARLSIFVYGSYLFWTALPFLAILALMGGGGSILGFLLSLLILAFQFYMVARLFVNFLFWQQSAALADLEGIEALRESRELARSRRDARWIDRPLIRGAILASIWFLIVFALAVGTELPVVFMHLQGATSLEEMRAILEKLATAPTPDAFMITATVVTSLIQAALRPLLGIAFVFLYIDAKADRAETHDVS
jgi:GYF domain 2